MGLLLRVGTLTTVYLLSVTSLHPGDVLVGVLLSALVVAAGRRLAQGDWAGAQPSGASLPGRLAGVPALLAGTLLDVARGSWQTARCCLTGRLPAPGLVAVPIPRSASSAAAWAVRVGLGPDSLVVEVDEQEGRMLLHVPDARDPDAVRAAQQDSYVRRQRRVFP